MAPFASIYTWPGNPRVYKALAAANLNGLEISLPTFTFGTTNIDASWVSKFPLAKVPALETHSDPPVCIAESGAIAHFLADSGPAREQLLGSTPAERARIQQWILHAEDEINPQVRTGVLPKVGRGEYNAEAEAQALAALARIVKVLESQLEKHQWVAETKELSLADLSVASSLTTALKLWLGPEWRAKYPKTIEWFSRTVGSKGVKEAFGEVELLKE
ncbi:glutathione S-transferase [Trichophaea hybrida]|nr:glutathione S-transferase [Trichophaea hybrida]